ncbi:hypothetical protein [Alteromonas sp. KUL49]|uniref:hypothetical protein n=1 Tax=Alteromonas sp. KUL49 TaxID=2480798 RepID=UPI00102F18EE|nr:hypothetical protein [Alteromonas sp. KUL49]TAP41482.1 hypothetical protein EYS00_04685 [Alteromonas sp. KUL49]GEA10569.1 hypothetical protein KUL49_09440 [Alteromonas sp. KUL49]
MKYEESLYLEENGQEKEIIHLYDLHQSLVVDHINAPNEIQRICMSSGEVIGTYQYGTDENYEGFSFAVSPRHNYLIVKEIDYGVSYDRLYATIYCLTDLQPNTPSNVDDYSLLSTPQLSSFHALNIMFSNDVNEQTVWVHGQEINNIPLIDTYEFGSSTVATEDNKGKLAQFYKVASYPAIALDKKVRDGSSYHFPNLTRESLFNTLDSINNAAYIKLCEYPTALVSKSLPAISELHGNLKHIEIAHFMYAVNDEKCDIRSFIREMATLGVPCKESVTTIGKTESTLVVSQFSIMNVPLFITQSIGHFAALCTKHGVIYEGAILGEHRNELHRFTLYSSLGNYCARGFVAVNDYITLFYLLRRKHDEGKIWDNFTPSQQRYLEDITLALSLFDDWEITEDELKQRITYNPSP